MIVRQHTGGSFTFSIVVADNDHELSARRVVTDLCARTSVEVRYCSEPRQNIALARNCALVHATGDFVAWIDDDEFPDVGWLSSLVAMARASSHAAVLGPVRPHFDSPPPRWLVEGRFCERREYATGMLLPWTRSFAGNALVRLDVIRQLEPPFRPEFGLGGEDVDFFRRLADLGHQAVWCNEAVVHEVVPPARWTRAYRLRRALMLGQSSLRLEGQKSLAKSLVAAPAYAVMLPLTLLFGQHVFVRYSIRLCSHLGRLLAFARLNPVRHRI